MRSKTLVTLAACIYLCVAETALAAPLSNFSFTGKEKSPNGPTLNPQQDFIENKGQVYGYDGLPHPEVKFVFQQGGTQIFLLEKGIAYQFTKTHYPEGYSELMKDKAASNDMEKLRAMQKNIRTETYRMDMSLAQANPNAVITTEGQSQDYVNYYNHNALNVHQYSKVIYHDIYPGIDWVIYAKNGTVKYDFIVKPGADPSRIKMDFKNQENLGVSSNGDFTLENSMGSVTEKKPVSYQQGKEINTAFTLKNNTLSFALGQYNAAQQLVIDPALTWATYYYMGYEIGWSCATDASGNVYMAGITSSALSLASGGHQNTYGGGTDAFLVKFNSGGARLWATYYGGADYDGGSFCATDASGNVYLAGVTSSTVNIASGGFQNTYGGGSGMSDAFLVKFNSGGTRLWGTYYGDTDIDYGLGCAVDPSGDVYLSGYTSSTVNIAYNGHQNTGGAAADAFLVKFSGSSGARLWATYYGGASQDYGYTCAADGLGNVFLSGFAMSSTNIGSGGFQNTGYSCAFLVKFNGSGVRQWGTYYGPNFIPPSSYSGIGYCAADVSGNVYLAAQNAGGATIASGGYQNTYGGGADLFLAKFDGTGARLWGTFYGGTGLEDGASCTVDAVGNVYLAGTTASTAGIASGGYQNAYGGGASDLFLVGFNSSGTRLWATYYGGPGAEDPGYRRLSSCSTDPSGNVYLAGTSQSSISIAYMGYQNSPGGAVMAKFCSGAALQPSAISGSTLVCTQSTASYSISTVPGAFSYTWTLPGSSWSGASTTNSISTTIGASGVLGVAITGSCGIGPTQTISIISNPVPSVSAGSGTICAGQNFSVTANGASTYTYSGGAVVSPSTSTVYSVTGTSTAGCTSTTPAVFTITVNQSPSVSASSGTICAGQNFSVTANGASTYTYSGGAVVSPSTSTIYSVMGTSTAGCTSGTAVFTITVNQLPIITVSNGSVCSGQSFTFVPSGAATYTYAGGSGVVTPTANTSYSVTGTSTAGCTSTAAAVFSITVVALPTISINASNTLICQGDAVTFTVTGADAYSLSTGMSGTTTTYVVVPPATGSYSISGSSGGCVTTTLVALTVNVCTGVKELAGDAAFSVYPNPGNGLFTITSGNFENSTISIYNLLGEKMPDVAVILSGQQQIDISHLASGMYLLVMQQQNKTTGSVRIIKE